MAKTKSSLSTWLAVMALLLVVGAAGLFWIAWRGVQMLREQASHAGTVMLGDASVLAGKTDWIGRWEGGPLKLDIDPSGSVVFEKVTPGSSEKLNGSLSFEGSDVVIDVFVMKKHLRIDKPPHLDGSRMVMTLDGVELERK